MKRITALLLCLCKLHNFCIDVSGDENTVPPETSAVDELTIVGDGGFQMAEIIENEYVARPVEILDGGEHFEDFPKDWVFRSQNELSQPREFLHSMVHSQGLERPRPRNWI